MRLFDYTVGEVRHEFISGHYELGPLHTATIAGHAIAYRIGDATIDNSCCGLTGCTNALVLGELIAPCTPAATTLHLREIDPAEPLAQTLREELTQRELVAAVNFYTVPEGA